MSSSQATPQDASPIAPPGGGRIDKMQTLEYNTDGHPRFRGCSTLKNYDLLDKLGEGTFGEVYKARHKQEGSLFALKKILMHNEKDGFPITALREIKLLKLLNHTNVLHLKEMAVEHTKRSGKAKSVMYMVMPYMSHDLSGLLENPNVKISEPIIKCYMLQLLKGVQYLHAKSILHRDMKAANLLISNTGILQIADFGLARQYEGPVPIPGKGAGDATRSYTQLVVTRWYRPPELLLSLKEYTTAIDMWGVGCVFGEMWKHKPILAGSSDLKQTTMIFDLVGNPTDETMPGWRQLPGAEPFRALPAKKGTIDHDFGRYSRTAEMLDLMKGMMLLDWRKRTTAVDALEHPYFKIAPLPIRPDQVPVFEESHELDRRKLKEAGPPPAPAGGTVGMGQHQGQWGQPPGEWGHPQNGNGRRGGGPNGRGYNNYNDRGNGHVYGGDRRSRGGPDARGPPNTSLPPRPPPSHDAGTWGPGGGGWNSSVSTGRQAQHGRGPQGGPAGTRENVDTYIPSYGGEGPPRRDGRRAAGGPGLDYGDGAADRRPGRDGDRFRDRDRDGYRDAQRTRSRSPGRRPPAEDRRDRGAYSWR